MAKIFIKDLLNINNFDPLNLDISFIQEVVNEIPENGVIEANHSVIFAARALRAADICGDLIAQLTRWEGYKKTEVKKEYGVACRERSEEKSDNKQKTYADTDQFYINMKNQHTDAAAVSLFLKEKKEKLMAFHYICKDIFKGQFVSRQASNFDSPEEVFESEPTGQIVDKKDVEEF